MAVYITGKIGSCGQKVSIPKLKQEKDTFCRYVKHISFLLFFREHKNKNQSSWM